MPNYVKNCLTIVGDEQEIKDCIKYCESSERKFDFEKIIPIPEELQVKESIRGNVAIKFYLTTLNERRATEVHNLLKITSTTSPVGNLGDEVMLTTLDVDEVKANPRLASEYINLAKQLLNNCATYGYPTWYEWCIDKWGTKWNAFEPSLSFSENQCKVEFKTAWYSPAPIIEALSQKYPNVMFSLCYADEDIGINCGYFMYDNGELQTFREYAGKEAVFFACNIWGADSAEYLDDSNDDIDEYIE